MGSWLAIDFLLNLFDLVAKGEVELKVGFDFFNTVHDSGVVFEANFACDFSSAHREFFA